MAQSALQSIAVSFYAYNLSGNQMPLRRVRIDWGDGTEQAVTEGSFKNRKSECRRYCAWSVNSDGSTISGVQPVSCTTNTQCGDEKQGTCRGGAGAGAACQFGGSECGSGTCVQNFCRVENFGDSADACIEDAGQRSGAFTFRHDYRCEGSIDPI